LKIYIQKNRIILSASWSLYGS